MNWVDDGAVVFQRTHWTRIKGKPYEGRVIWFYRPWRCVRGVWEPIGPCPE